MTAVPASVPTGQEAEPYKVLVVDDSAVIRGFFRRALESDPAIKVTAAVGNGQYAVDMMNKQSFDVVVLDIEMPVMDGLTALPLMLESDPGIKVVMASTLTVKNADVSLKALAAGAADYIPKPSTASELHSAQAFKIELINKVKALGRARRRQSSAPAAGRSAPGQALQPAAMMQGARSIALCAPSTAPVTALAIGSSTGGPQALLKLIGGLGAKFQLPIFITQHMPATFTGILAEHISRLGKNQAAEGVDGAPVENGRVYVAPGEFHMLVERVDNRNIIRLTKDAPENFCRPAVDPMLRSLATVYGRNLLGVILTGMGRDGRNGGQAVVAAGGTVVAQDEASSVVWGMPGAVAEAGICSAVLPLDDIAAHVRKISGRPAA